MTIAFIGLGIMGSRMAENLLIGGHQLWVYNRTKEKAKELLDKGAHWAENPAEAAKNADVLVTMLEKPAVVEKLASGENGFISSLKKDALWIDCSTVNPTFSKKMAQLSTENSVRFMDAPVSGSKVPAAEANLIFLVGGNEKDLEEARPLLSLMGKKIIHVGDHSKGSAMKLMINQLLGQGMLAFSESLSLGIAMGIDKSKAMDILLESGVTAPILKAFRPRIENNDYAPNFPLRHLQKDLQLFTETAYECQKAVPSTNVAKEIYGMAKQKEKEDVDFSAIFKFLNE